MQLYKNVRRSLCQFVSMYIDYLLEFQGTLANLQSHFLVGFGFQYLGSIMVIYFMKAARFGGKYYPLWIQSQIGLYFW